MANNNRNKGHSYERQLVKELKELGYEAVSSRSESRNMDNRGIDIVSNFPFYIQAKVSINQPNIHKLLTETDAELIFFKNKKKQREILFLKKNMCV